MRISQTQQLPIKKGGKVFVRVADNQLHFEDPNGVHKPMKIMFHRTLRLPEDNKVYPLPPSMGSFPIYRVEDYQHTVPESWKVQGGVFICMYQREAMWMQFTTESDRDPKAVKVAVGKVNAISGKTWSPELKKAALGEQQDYCIVPKQPWLDGINAGTGYIKQFVAMEMGQGYTVEAQVTGEEKVGGLQLLVANPKAAPVPQYSPPPRRHSELFDSKSYGAAPSSAMCDDLFSFDAAPASSSSFGGFGFAASAAPAAPALAYSAAPMQQQFLAKHAPQSRRRESEQAKEIGLAAGGKMQQEIFADQNSIDFWDQENAGRVFVHLVNPQMFRQITGMDAPETTITAESYTQAGYPWFAYYDEGPTVSKSSVLAQVKSVAEIDVQKNASVWPKPDNSTVQIPAHQVIELHAKTKPKDQVFDGFW